MKGLGSSRLEAFKMPIKFRCLDNNRLPSPPGKLVEQTRLNDVDADENDADINDHGVDVDADRDDTQGCLPRLGNLLNKLSTKALTALILLVLLQVGIM